MTGAGDEFALIARHFAPLATKPEARGLLDDAAVLAASGPRVVTMDTIVEGVHFLASDPIDRVAQKALRVNVSDIAAKGAVPLFYLLSLQWPDHRPATDIAVFAAGLARDQAAFGCGLLGGDTVATPGPLAVSVTMLGAPVRDPPPSRAGARCGDDLWVTGTVGDGALGLSALRGLLTGLDAGQVSWLADRYQRPSPRVELAAAVALHARASIDVSDGLLGDAAKIAKASGVRLRIEPDAVPLSAPAAAWLALQPDRQAGLAALLCGGDDYEILFAAPPAARGALTMAAADAGLRLTRIGEVADGDGVDAGGLAVAGHAHRLGA